MQETIYRIQDLSFSYHTGDRRVLDEVSLQLDKGDVLCVLGPNGAGKTTLLNCMAGLLKPDAGNVEICGKNIADMKAKEIANIVGYVPQMHSPAFDYTVLDFVVMGCAPKTGTFSRPGKEEEAMCMDILRSMGIDDLAAKSYLDISGGERQQVLIARAIAQKPKAILFDEPTAHLDFGNQHRVLNRIKQMAEEGFSIIITTHNPDHALLLGDKAAVVDRHGKISQGNVEDIITEERLRDVYDIDLHLEYVEEINRVACFAPELDKGE